MKFRVREGFKLFNSPGDAAAYECHGPKSGVRPIEAGKVVKLTDEQVTLLRHKGKLGGLEPVDDEAIRVYGDTPELISAVIEHPERYAVRSEPPRVEFSTAGAR